MSGAEGRGVPNRLRVFRFPPGTAFTGEILGAIERTEGDLLLDALAIMREDATGEVRAVDLATGRAGGTIAPLLDFRLDAARRLALTRRTLEPHAGGVPPEVIEAVGVTVEPGGALVAVLLAGDRAPALDEAVAQDGGRVVADTAVAARALADLGPQLVSVAEAIDGVP